jgi:hypothetical protein
LRQPHGAVVVRDNDVNRAVIVDISEGRRTADFVNLKYRAPGLRRLAETLSAALVME